MGQNVGACAITLGLTPSHTKSLSAAPFWRNKTALEKKKIYRGPVLQRIRGVDKDDELGMTIISNFTEAAIQQQVVFLSFCTTCLTRLLMTAQERLCDQLCSLSSNIVSVALKEHSVLHILIFWDWNSLLLHLGL